MSKPLARNCISDSGAIHNESGNRCSGYLANLSGSLPSDGGEWALRRDDLSAHCIAHFHAKYQPSEGCWLWQAGRYPKGYGMVSIGRTEDGRQINNYAHRVAYVLAKGPIPKGLVVRHRCDVPACVNPDHLLLGTQADNIHDALRQGHYNVPHQKKQKLSDGDVAAIRLSFAKGVDLARAYRVTPAFICLLRRGERRKVAACACGRPLGISKRRAICAVCRNRERNFQQKVRA